MPRNSTGSTAFYEGDVQWAGGAVLTIVGINGCEVIVANAPQTAISDE